MKKGKNNIHHFISISASLSPSLCPLLWSTHLPGICECWQKNKMKNKKKERARERAGPHVQSYFKSIPFIPFPRRSFPLSRARSLSIALSFTLSITTLFSSHTVPSLFLSHLSPADTRVANVLLLVVVDVGSEQVAILSTSSSLMTLWLNQYSEWKLIRMIKTVKLSML